MRRHPAFPAQTKSTEKPPGRRAGQEAFERMAAHTVQIVGGGLAGSEAAFQLAERGVRVRLFEMRPTRRSPAHQTGELAELVCSNSLRSDDPATAVGLLHEELRRLGSLVLAAADQTRIPAGGALAVDRELFPRRITELLSGHPLIEIIREEVCRLPRGPGLAIVASGPLTSDALAGSLGALVGERPYFYDAMAPIVAGESVDTEIAFFSSRYGKGGGGDYLNLPLGPDAYHAFVDELLRAEKVAPHAFEQPRYFEGCLPIEVMAERGRECLAFGPMKPVGLADPRTGQRPYAVVQLRPENAARTAWNLVGFQTRLTWPEQRRIFRTLPGLANAEFLRLGQIHRNTFVDAPRVLAEDLSLKAAPHILLAGQLTGVEGYVESTACGLLAAMSAFARLEGRSFAPPAPETALGALAAHLSGRCHPPGYEYQPANVTFALFPPLEARVRKHERKQQQVARARACLRAWLEGSGSRFFTSSPLDLRAQAS